MAETLKHTYAAILVASVTKTASDNSATLTLPIASSHTFFLNCTAASGTTPTLDVWLQITPDDGTTWIGVRKFAQLTAAGGRVLTLRPRLGYGEASTETIANNSTPNDPANTAAVVGNLAMSEKVRFRYVIAGTTPSFTFAIHHFASHADGPY